MARKQHSDEDVLKPLRSREFTLVAIIAELSNQETDVRIGLRSHYTRNAAGNLHCPVRRHRHVFFGSFRSANECLFWDPYPTLDFPRRWALVCQKEGPQYWICGPYARHRCWDSNASAWKPLNLKTSITEGQVRGVGRQHTCRRSIVSAAGYARASKSSGRQYGSTGLPGMMKMAGLCRGKPSLG